MIQLDDNFLKDFGLDRAPQAEKDRFVASFYSTLNNRVGLRLAEQLNEQQLQEFEAASQNGQDAQLKWLQANLPDQEQVVMDELEKLKTEIKQKATKAVERYQQKHQTSDG